MQCQKLVATHKTDNFDYFHIILFIERNFELHMYFLNIQNF